MQIKNYFFCKVLLAAFLLIFSKISFSQQKNILTREILDTPLAVIADFASGSKIVFKEEVLLDEKNRVNDEVRENPLYYALWDNEFGFYRVSLYKNFASCNFGIAIKTSNTRHHSHPYEEFVIHKNTTLSISSVFQYGNTVELRTYTGSKKLVLLTLVGSVITRTYQGPLLFGQFKNFIENCSVKKLHFIPGDELFKYKRKELK